MEAKWYFPESNGGQDSGIHHSGIETFRGGPFYQFLARELVQNSIDAQLDESKPVCVQFDVLDLLGADIPDIKGLESTIKKCYEFWDHEEQAADFLKNAITVSNGEHINVLRVSDFNTTGLCGKDDDIKESWYNLVRCAGSSFKPSGAAGSYGIGKNAPFASSELRTVLYSTYSKDNNHSFAGVSILVTHKKENNLEKLQPIGFLGLEKGTSIHNTSNIPTSFLRNEYGTDIYTLGFPKNTAWISELVFSILDNFWLSIVLGYLEAKVGEVIINTETLVQLLEEYSCKPDFTAHHFYRAYVTPSIDPIVETLPLLGEVEAYMYVADEDLPKLMMMTRKSGMKIFAKQFRSPIPFCGVFICKNTVGNKILRRMEPPCHDNWDPNLPKKGANKAVQDEYVKFIRSCVQKIIPTESSTVVDIPGLNKFLPDDENSLDETFESPTGNADEGGAGESPNPVKNEVIILNPTRVVVKSKAVLDQEPDPEPNPTPAPIPNTSTTALPNPPPNPPPNPLKQAISINARAFSEDPKSEKYTISLSASDKTVIAKSAKVRISTAGEDMNYPLEISSAQLEDGTKINVAPNGILGPVTIDAAMKTKIYISLKYPEKLALEVAAYEA